MKICAVTGTRAEYGLLYWLLKEIKEDPRFELKLIVTNMHLSPEFGNTYLEIEKDGFLIDEKIPILSKDDSRSGIVVSTSKAITGFERAFSRLKPDAILILGDRYEVFAAAATATILNIPIIHLHGGEITEGAVDNIFRHVITKMSHFHFTSTDVFRNRVVQMGEDPSTVFNVGALGIENINRLKLLSRSELENELDIKLQNKNLLVTFHPVTLEENSTEQFNELISALEEIEETLIIITKPNSDAGGRALIQVIDEIKEKNPDKYKVFTSLGQLRYLSLLQFVDAVVGNSSSGLVEVPSFKTATINIGNRQEGRIKAASVIDCKPLKNSIIEALEKALSPDFRKMLKNVINPYDQGNTSEKIINILLELDFKNCLKKKFYDIEIND